MLDTNANPELVQPFLLRSAKAGRNKQGEGTNFGSPSDSMCCLV